MMADVELSMNFNQIYLEYYRKSYLYVKSYVHDEVVAEDIVTDSLLKLWEKLKTEKIDNISPYIFTIIRNATLDHLRHSAVKQKALKNIQKKLNNELDLRISTIESCDPSEIFSAEIKEIFQNTLNKLPEKSRRVIQMSRFEFKTNKEISEELGISVKGVDYHISIVLKKLRKNLQDYLPIFFFF